jgi:hypothetical protein
MDRRTFLKGAAMTCLASLIPQHPILEDQIAPNPIQAQTGFEKYGRVIFSRNPEAQNQLYIIGQWHEDPITNEVGPAVPLIQTQIYRICESIRKKGVKLLIQEGIDINNLHYQSFLEETRKNTGGATEIPKDLDYKLEEIFNSPDLNAGEFFVINNPDMIIRGADDAQLIDSSLKSYENLPDVFKYACKLRSLLAMSGYFKIAPEEFNKKRIPNVDAMLIIGSAHINDFEEYVNNSRIYVPEFRLPSGVMLKPMSLDIPLEKMGVGIQIILPNAIKDYRDK